MKMFGKRRRRRHGKKCKEAIQIIGRCWNELAIPFHDVGCLTQFIEHRATIEYVDRMQFERERSYDPKVPAAAAKGPEQVGVLFSIGRYKLAIRQYHIGRKQIVDGQSAFAG